MPNNAQYVKAIIIDPLDNVATAVEDIQPGEEIRLALAEKSISLTVAELIPDGHKVALKPIAKDGAVLKYGQSIGTSLADIAPGRHVHIHNMASNRGRGDLQSGKGEKSCR